MSRATAMPADARRRAIIEAVEPLLLAHGPALTTRQLAEAAGVAEGTLFRVFASKQELLAAAALAALRVQPAIEQLRAVPAGDSLHDRVSRILTILQAELRRTRALSMTLHPPGEPSPNGTSGRHKLFNHYERRQRLLDAVTGALDDYADRLAVRPRVAAQLLLTFSFATSLDPGQNPPLPEADDLTEVVLHGIARGTT